MWGDLGRQAGAIDVFMRQGLGALHDQQSVA